MGTSIGPEICYCLVLEDDDPLKTTPFQGFSPGWLSLTWVTGPHRVVQLQC